MDEKRSFVRAFAKRIELDPESRKGQAQLFMLPDLAAATRYELHPPGRAATAKSSFSMVAGAGFEPAAFRL